MVAPYTGAWIEIRRRRSQRARKQVAPYTGAWIEIAANSEPVPDAPSLPTRERGLKLSRIWEHGGRRQVAPYTGAWIEIMTGTMTGRPTIVAPYTGAWIEIIPAVRHL